MLRWAAQFLIALLTISALPHASFAERRVALVVGNSNYPDAPLANPKNDASDLSEALKRLNFEVAKGLDLTTLEFDRALDGFTTAAKDADVALFFFSGHGVQIDKRGYLAPVDFNAPTESSALRQLVAIQDSCFPDRKCSQGEHSRTRRLPRQPASAGNAADSG